MTRKHFIAIANILAYNYRKAQESDSQHGTGFMRTHSETARVEEVAQDLAGYFKEQSENFNYERFMSSVVGDSSTKEI